MLSSLARLRMGQGLAEHGMEVARDLTNTSYLTLLVVSHVSVQRALWRCNGFWQQKIAVERTYCVANARKKVTEKFRAGNYISDGAGHVGP